MPLVDNNCADVVEYDDYIDNNIKLYEFYDTILINKLTNFGQIILKGRDGILNKHIFFVHNNIPYGGCLLNPIFSKNKQQYFSYEIVNVGLHKKFRGNKISNEFYELALRHYKIISDERITDITSRRYVKLAKTYNSYFYNIIDDSYKITNYEDIEDYIKIKSIQSTNIRFLISKMKI